MTVKTVRKYEVGDTRLTVSYSPGGRRRKVYGRTTYEHTYVASFMKQGKLVLTLTLPSSFRIGVVTKDMLADIANAPMPTTFVNSVKWWEAYTTKMEKNGS